jgi:hypothetical protein
VRRVAVFLCFLRRVTVAQALRSLNGRGQLRVAGLWDRFSTPHVIPPLTTQSLTSAFPLSSNSQPHWIGGRGNDWRMLLQADYSASFRMDAVHRGRQINESVTDDVAASMLGAFPATLQRLLPLSMRSVSAPLS